MNVLHMVTQFIAATLFSLGAIYLVYLYYRQQMPGGLKGVPQISPKRKLQVEQSQFLEPKKAVHVLRVGQERFLVASTEQGLSLISPLEAMTEAELLAEEDALKDAQLTLQNAPSMSLSRFSMSSFGQRLGMSLRMTLADRFGKARY
jgi:flagellar biogenesis protein FliO